MKHNYLVSVFAGGRNVNSYYSENLDDLVTIKAMHKDCEISIFDLNTFETLSKEVVDAEIQRSRARWKRSPKKVCDKPGKNRVRKERIKVSKYWERPVRCVETGQVFPTIKECSEHLGVSHKSIWNAINSGRARHGLHFVNARMTEQ